MKNLYYSSQNSKCSRKIWACYKFELDNLNVHIWNSNLIKSGLNPALFIRSIPLYYFIKFKALFFIFGPQCNHTEGKRAFSKIYVAWEALKQWVNASKVESEGENQKWKICWVQKFLLHSAYRENALYNE